MICVFSKGVKTLKVVFQKLNYVFRNYQIPYLKANSIFKKSFVFNENLHCCHGHRHGFTCSRQMCSVMCGNNIIYDMMLSTE